MNYLLEYYREIKEGRIPVGQELKATLDKLIKDLDDPRYTFDEKAPEKHVSEIRKKTTPERAKIRKIVEEEYDKVMSEKKVRI